MSYIAVQVSEADGEGIDLGMSFREQDADIFGIVPSERFGHGEFLTAVSSFQFPDFRQCSNAGRYGFRKLETRKLKLLPSGVLPICNCGSRRGSRLLLSPAL